MTMPPRVRKLALTAHVVCSVGWIGAVLVFLTLALIGLMSPDAATVRGAYLVMEPAAWYALVPFAATSLFTGIIQGLGTPWGLFRHYWVLFKLLITVYSITFLLTFMESFRIIAGMAADPGTDLAMLRDGGSFVRFHAVLALSLLIVATVLAVYKPRGLTRYGWRKQQEQRTKSRERQPEPVS